MKTDDILFIFIFRLLFTLYLKNRVGTKLTPPYNIFIRFKRP